MIARSKFFYPKSLLYQVKYPSPINENSSSENKLSKARNSTRNHDRNTKPSVLKVQEATTSLRHRRVEKIAILFKFMDVFIFLAMMYRFSAPLLFAVNISGGYFRGISLTSCSPVFAFVTGNVIILILLFRSGMTENGGGGGNSHGEIDLYDEYFMTYEKSSFDIKSCNSTVIGLSNVKKICRSRSEDLMRVKCADDQTHRKLRRSITERKLNNLNNGCGGFAEDKLSGDEFRQTVEAFIARQQKSLRDEEFSPIVHLSA